MNDQNEINKGLKLIDAIVKSIENDSEDMAMSLLERLVLFRQDSSDKIVLFKRLSMACYDYGRQSIMRSIVYHFDESDKLTDSSILYDLFTTNEISNKILKFICKCFIESVDTITYNSIMVVFIGMDNSEEITTACKRLEKRFDPLSYDAYKGFRNLAREEGSTVVEEYMTIKMIENSPYVKEPSYVKNYEYSHSPNFFGILNKLSDVEVPSDELLNLSPDEAGMILVSGLYETGISTDDREKAEYIFSKTWEESSVTARRLLIKPFINKVLTMKGSDNTDILTFRLLGPSNPMLEGYEEDDDSMCSTYGCRMLYCNCYTNNDNWFINEDQNLVSCDTCHLRFSNRTHAIRLPDKNGGWVGKFCCVQCAMKYQIRVEHVEGRRVEREEIRRQLLTLYMNEIEEIGLQKRQNEF